MKERPRIPLLVLGTLGFVTLFMCQTGFKMKSEILHEVYPPLMETMDAWFLFSDQDRFKCVLRIFFVISSPVLSLISTGLLLLGHVKSNPYFFIPWLFLTLKGLLFIQTDNLFNILRDTVVRSTYSNGFGVEHTKWILLYFTIFLLEVFEVCAFYEILDLFFYLWNDHPGFNVESANQQVTKKEMAELLDTFSECSLSKFSLDNFIDYLNVPS